MSDFDLYNRQDNRQTQDRSSQSSFNEQTSAAGADAKQRAGQALGDAANAASERLKGAADAAMGVASDAADKVQEKVRDQQHAGADFIDRLAEDIRNAARAFESDVPFAARGIDSAADYVEDAADKIRSGTFRDVLDGTTDFAKRQPAAFLGLSVLAGFAAVRFLKASSGNAAMPSGNSSPMASGVNPATWDNRS